MFFTHSIILLSAIDFLWVPQSFFVGYSAIFADKEKGGILQGRKQQSTEREKPPTFEAESFFANYLVFGAIKTNPLLLLLYHF